MKPFMPLTILLWAICSSSAAQSDALPKLAEPLTAQEVTAIYSGHSSKWSSSSAWFAPDMSVKGVFGKKLDGGYFQGKWSVEENEICMRVEFKDLKTDKTGNSTDCWKWYRDGKKRLWTLWSTRYDGSKPPKNDYYRNETKKLVAGDIVSGKFDKLSKK